MKSLIFKTKTFYVIQGNYGYGWDDLTCEDTKEEALEQKKCYDENERGVPHRIRSSFELVEKQNIALHEFFKGIEYESPVIQINNATELHALQQIAKEKKIEGSEHFAKKGYKEILHILEINYCRLHNKDEITGGVEFYCKTRGRKSFLVEYRYSKQGFAFGELTCFDESRKSYPGSFPIIQMSKILKELEEA